jgi:dTDP-glucose 4,6-dehydratase
MKVLVCGGAGFIGSHFVRSAPADVKIVVLDALRYSGHLSTLADVWDRVRFYPGQVQDRCVVEGVVKAEGVSHIVNFAAESHNDRSLLSRNQFVETNVMGVSVLLDVARDHGLERILHVSTDEVYGSIDQGQFTEESPVEPNTPYSAAKAGGDLLCRAHFKSFGTPVVVTRGGNTYGPYQYPEKLIPFFLTRLIDGKKVPLYGEGRQTREWIHVSDHANGIWTALQKGVPGETYNIGDHHERTNSSIVSLLISELQVGDDRVKRIPDPRRGAHDSRYSMKTEKIQSLGWRPVMPFEESLRETARWYVGRQDWWRPLVSSLDYIDFVKRFYGPSLGDDL